jgi:hypothetical protein
MESMQFRSGNNYEWFFIQRDSDLVGKSSGKNGKKKAKSDTRSRVSPLIMGPQGAQITNASQMVFFTSATDRNPAKASQDIRRERLIGDVNCVGYKLVYRDQILNEDASSEMKGFPVYALYRNVVSAEDTVQNLLGSTDLWTAYDRYRSDETTPSNFLEENIVELTLIFEVTYQKKAGHSGDKGLRNETQSASVLVPVMTTGGNRLGSCSQLDVYGNRLNIIADNVNVDDLNSGRVTGVTISMTVVTDEGMRLVDQVRQQLREAPSPEVFFERYTRSFAQRISLPMGH